MIQLTTLYDNFIDRPKLSEQKKIPFEYIVPPPLKWVGIKTSSFVSIYLPLSELKAVYEDETFNAMILRGYINFEMASRKRSISSDNCKKKNKLCIN